MIKSDVRKRMTRWLPVVGAAVLFTACGPSNKKIVVGLKPPWEHEEPVWELRVGPFRVFYDVNEAEQSVVIRAVREKTPHRTTEEIL